jgi:hypothetical protein
VRRGHDRRRAVVVTSHQPTRIAQHPAHRLRTLFQQITSETSAALAKSFGSATDLASRYPQYSESIIAAARQSFLDGANGAYLVGIIAMVGGAALVWFLFPRRDREREMYQQFGTD